MKVTNVRTFLVCPGRGKNWLFVKVETDEGIFEIHVHQLGRYLAGRRPFNIKHFTFMAYHDFAGKRGSMDLYCAISGIEQALWDIGEIIKYPGLQPAGRRLQRKNSGLRQRLE